MVLVVVLKLLSLKEWQGAKTGMTKEGAEHRINRGDIDKELKGKNLKEKKHRNQKKGTMASIKKLNHSHTIAFEASRPL